MSDTEESPSSSTEAPAPLRQKATKVQPKHPPYVTMLVDAVREQQVRNQGVSRAKIVQFIKSKYKLEDVSAPALKKAVQLAEDKEMIERKTGTGMNGSYVLTKKEKLESKKAMKKAAKSEDESGKEEKATKTKTTTTTTTTAAKSKVLKEDKVNVKKKPARKEKTAGKGKENQKEKWKKGDEIRKPKILEAKVALTKAKISRDLLDAADNDHNDGDEEPVASTSKQRNATKKKATATSTTKKGGK